jgi:hypothetical protein
VNRDKLFRFFISGLFVILCLFGMGTAASVLFGDEALALRMINVFSGMFAAVVGIGTGYLLGTRNGNGSGDK